MSPPSAATYPATSNEAIEVQPPPLQGGTAKGPRHPHPTFLTASPCPAAQLPSTLSFHLRDLSTAGLLATRRKGRTLHYRAIPERIRSLQTCDKDGCRIGHQ